MKDPTLWTGCYGEQLTGYIVKEAFAHPAKFSKRLIERIYDHALAQGWLKPGDLVGDPFGGVGVGGIAAAYRGLAWIGCELEGKFVHLARQNFELHRYKLAYLGKPLPQIVQGDSRQFARIVGEVAASVTSPPYNKPFSQDHHGNKGGKRPTGQAPSSDRGAFIQYGQTHGQIEGLKNGTVDGAITSPPYASIAAGAGGLNTKPPKHSGQQGGRSAQSVSQNSDQRYGDTSGQISKLADGVVTSPPWEKNCEGSRKASKFKDAAATLKCNRGHGASDEAVLSQAQRDMQKTYGESPGNIGQTQKETYWQAMATVYGQCFDAIKPGGVLAVVVKDYVKDKKVVLFCDDTRRLLEHLGFVLLEEVQALLSETKEHADLFAGAITIRKERKSFFRRLAEFKGSPRIDWETVLFLRKPQ